jgi:hypothetical protein
MSTPLKSLKVSLFGTGQYATIVDEAARLYSATKLPLPDTNKLKRRLAELKKSITDLPEARTNKDTQKINYIKVIYNAISRLIYKTTKPDDLFPEYMAFNSFNFKKIANNMSVNPNLSNTSIKARQLLERIAKDMVQWNEKEMELHVKQIEQIPIKAQQQEKEKQRMNDEAAELLGIKKEDISKYPKSILMYIQAYTDALQSMGQTDETIQKNNFLKGIHKQKLVQFLPNEFWSSVMPTPPTAGVFGAGTGFKGGKQTRKGRTQKKKAKLTKKHKKY